MGIKTAYQGYQAYHYLKAGADISTLEMCQGDRRVEEYLIPLTSEEEARVLELARDNIFISMHEHPVLFPENIGEDIFAYNREGKQRCAYEALSRGYFDVIFDNLMDGTCNIMSQGGWKWDEILFDIGMRACDLAHQDFVFQCRSVEDIRRAHREGKLGLVFTLEGASPIENEVDRIDILYGLGVRSMGITYSETNALGSGMKEEKDGGLTLFGKRCVERMNQVGMLIDCSHVGKQTTLDTIEYSSKPIVLSHVGARSLWDSKRLVTDEVLLACAKKGGVIGIEAAPHTTITRNHPVHTVESVMEHFEYVRNLVGVDHVSFGPDTLYGDHVGLHNAYAGKLSLKTVQGEGFPRVEYVKGMENPTEASKNILRYLVKAGYSDEDIQKVMGGNILRVLEAVWGR